MKAESSDLLQAFLAWAGMQQRALLTSPYQVTLILGSPKAVRTAMLEIVLHRKEDGWVHEDIVMFGSIIVWENGSVDAEVHTERSILEDAGPAYFKNWYPVDPADFGPSFQPFLGFFDKTKTAAPEVSEH